MQAIVIGATVLSLALVGTSGALASDEDANDGATPSPDVPLAADGDGGAATGDQAERGLSVVPKTGFGRGYVFDVVSTGDELVAVGYGVKGSDRTHGAAWTSSDGRTWKKTHRLPSWSFWRATPTADGTVLATRGTRQGCYRLWRLEPDGRVMKAGVIWPSKPCRPGRGKEVIELAGRPGAGMVAVYGGLDRRLRPDVLTRVPGEGWARARVPGFGKVYGYPVEVVETPAGFVLVAEDRVGIKAWRSADGLDWSGPELLPDSVVTGPEGQTRTVYDEVRDILLVLTAPDRVWRSTAGGPFESVGPLAAPIEGEDDRFVGAALADGFLVGVSDYEKLRLQTSTEGAIWTRAPDEPDYSLWWPVDWMIRHGDEVIAGSESGDPLLAGPATLEAYLP